MLVLEIPCPFEGYECEIRWFHRPRPTAKYQRPGLFWMSCFFQAPPQIILEYQYQYIYPFPLTSFLPLERLVLLSGSVRSVRASLNYQKQLIHLLLLIYHCCALFYSWWLLLVWIRFISYTIHPWLCFYLWLNIWSPIPLHLLLHFKCVV